MARKKQPKSVYAPGPSEGKPKSHTLSLLVDNVPGTLSRIVGLFTGRGYNIDSLTVAETDHNNHIARITIVTQGTEKVLYQITTQLESLIPVRSVRDLTTHGDYIGRELSLIKVSLTRKTRSSVIEIGEKFGAAIVDSDGQACMFQISGKSGHIDDFIQALRPHGIQDVSRSGIAALTSGTSGT